MPGRAVLARALEQGYWTPEQRAAYARRLQVLISRAGRIEDGTVRAMRRLLREGQQETVERIAFAIRKAEEGGSTFDLARIGSTIQEIEGRLLELGEGAGRISRTAAEETADVGRLLVDEPLRVALGTDILPAHQLPRSTVAAAADFSADLITRMTRDGIRRISAEIQLGAIGVKDPREVLEAVGRNLDDPSIFGSLANRAEVITRTELGRLHSIAGQARQEEALQVVRNMQKQWLWSGKARLSHAAAHGQIRDVYEDYDVGGEKLMFPRDPKGSAANTIFCGCSSLPYIGGLSEELPTVEQQAA
jgi:hypothetical protein